MLTIVDALNDRRLFAGDFPADTWRPWSAYLRAAFALPLDGEALALYQRCTGRQSAPGAPAREVWTLVGRRGGKSRVAALVAVYLAAFRDYGAVLAKGEVGTLPIVAADRRQARTVMGYVTGLLDTIPMLRRMVTKRTAESIELNTGCRIEIHTASWRALRGYTCVGAVLDEVCFWRSEDSSNPDHEIVTALRPAMATVPQALLVAISSPHSRRGVAWDMHRRHYGRDGNVLVWQAPSRDMNPTVPEALVTAALEADPDAARAEWLAEFRSDLEAFVSREVLEACTVPGRHELPPCGLHYLAFVDPSGGSSDSMTLAIAHGEGERVVIDCVREQRAPFSPDAVVQDFAALLKSYRISVVTGDRYGGEWPAERFRVHGISYQPSEQTKSELYQAALPLLNGHRVELLDEPRLLAQLGTLERRTSRGGRDSVDHAPGGHDDVANAAAGALVLAVAQAPAEPPMGTGLRDTPNRGLNYEDQFASGNWRPFARAPAWH
jgi:hypothetical protein